MKQNIILFLTLCMGSRYSLAYISKNYLNLLPYLSLPALLIAIGFAIIYIFDLRKIGSETGGEKIYWNNFRPVHSLMYGIFAYLAFHKDPNAWKVIFLDTTIGLSVFLRQHIENGF
jgi:hypothetical protein